MYAKQEEYPEINFDYDISINELKINEKDITALLFNLIDNACDEALKTDKKVAVMIKEKQTILIVKVSNQCVSKPNFISRKGSNHGYGLKIINGIVNKYNSDIFIEYHENQVVFNIKINVRGDI